MRLTPFFTTYIYIYIYCKFYPTLAPCTKVGCGSEKGFQRVFGASEKGKKGSSWVMTPTASRVGPGDFQVFMDLVRSPLLHPIRPDSTRSDPTRPDPTRPDPTRPDQTRPDPTRPDLLARFDPTHEYPSRNAETYVTNVAPVTPGIHEVAAAAAAAALGRVCVRAATQRVVCKYHSTRAQHA